MILHVTAGRTAGERSTSQERPQFASGLLLEFAKALWRDGAGGAQRRRETGVREWEGAGGKGIGILGALAMRGLQQTNTASSMLQSGSAAARQLPWVCAPGCARMAVKPDYVSVIVKNAVRLMDGIGHYVDARVGQATSSLGVLLDTPESLIVDFDKEVAVLKMEETLHTETSLGRKTKRPWRGKLRHRSKSPQAPWSEDDCAQRVDSMLSELEEDGITGAWAVANVLDAWVGKVTRVDLSKVIRELGLRRNADLALEVFQWMQVQKGRLKPNGHTYSLVLGVLGRGGLIIKARQLFDTMLSSEVEVGVYSFNAMIGAYARRGNFKKAWRLYEDMVEKGIQADEITLSTLLSGVGKADLPVETAEKIFLRIKENGILPNVQTYNALISVLSRGGHGERCKELDIEMQKMEVVPDIFTFNTLLMMHVQAGRFNEATQVHQRIRDAGLQPSVVTYTGLIQMYSRASKHKEAIEMFLEMQRVGCKPDLTIYSLMIKVYGKAGSAEEAALVFKQLQKAGLRPNVVTWSALIQVFGWQGKTQEVGGYFNEMLTSGCLPDMTLYNIMMGAYGRNGHSVQAAILFRRMQAQGISPNAISYDTMIQAYCFSKQAADAQVVLDQMTHAGYSPDKISRAMLQQIVGVQNSGDSQIRLSRKERRRMVVQRPVNIVL